MKAWRLILAFIVLAAGVEAGIRAPYTADSHTLHLYHYDETSGAIQDSGSGSNIPLSDVVATYTNPACSAGFGTSLYMIPNGYYGTPTNIGGRAASSEGCTQAVFQATGGAFTYEALIRTTNTTTGQYILSHDGQNRGFNVFILTGSLSFQPDGAATYSATIPASGAHAFNSNTWFHVAMTYNGLQGTVSNLLFYWTALLPGTTNANLIGAFSMTADALACTNQFFTGCLARAPSRLELMGWLDEVRISDNVRAPGEFIFYSPPTVQNTGASNVTVSSADLSGTLSATGQAATAVLVYWGTTDGGTNAAAWVNTNLFAAPQGLGALITNVTFGVSNTTYSYRYCATNADCVSWADSTATFMPGMVWVQATTPTATYGTAGVFTVYRPLTATNGPLTVNYTLSGSAGNGVDYALLSGNVTIPDGSSNAVVAVTPTVDMENTDEEVTLTLASGAYLVGAPAAATVTITPWSGLTAITGNWYVAVNGNDTWMGTNWATAFATISNGVGRATNSQTVLVGLGSYSVSTQLVVASNITLLGVAGAGNTVVTRNPVLTNRLMYVNSAGAVIDSLTFSNGLWDNGAGVYMSAGTLKNCIIANNNSYERGSRDYGAGVSMATGLVSNCVFRGNRGNGSYAKGGGLNAGGGTIQNCVFFSNRANENGSAMCLAGSSARALNCLVYGNSGNNAVFFYASGGQLLNSTVASNASWGIVVESAGTGGWITNTLCAFNTSGDVQPAYTGRYSYCCSPLLTSGVGNTTNNPKFVSLAANDFRLAADSPCLDIGYNGFWQLASRDLDGYLRIQHGVVDLGAYERPGGFGCNFASDRTTGFVPLTNILTAYVSGTNLQSLYYAWDVNADGVVDQEGYDKAVITNVYTLPGLYSVALLVSNAIGQVDAFTNANYISVSTPSMYVSPAGANTLPYSSWATAATTIQAAVSFAADGTTVFITNGTYTLTNTVAVTLGMTLKGVNGAGPTVVAGNGTFPCFLVSHSGAVLDGLTVSNGYSVLDGGGLSMFTGTVQNCVIRNNRTSRYGGGLFLGNGTLKNCLIVGNASLGNIAPLATAGGGVYMTNGAVLHCTIADNTAVRGGANAGDGLVMTGGGVSNSIVYFNSAFPYAQSQRNVYKTGGSFVYTCTIPAVAGTSNTIADPQFVDRLGGDYRLLPGSPCIDRGTNLVGFATDIEGASRPLDGDTLASVVSDMGAYEAEAINAGTFRCNFIVATNEGVTALSNVVFNAYVAGAVTNVQSYYWDFTNDGGVDVAGAGQSPVSNTYGVGFHSVRLAATNTSGQGASVAKPGYIRVGSPIIYASTNGLATLPYDTWAKAATNLNAAMEAAYTVGSTQQVVVSNGWYGLDRQLELLGPILLTGFGGASNTVAYRSGTYVHRIAYMTNPVSVIDGVTLTNGYENTTAYGGGVLMTTGKLQNCIVVKNTDAKLDDSRPYGGGVYATGGVISNCIVRNNSSVGSYGKVGGICLAPAVMQRCLVEGNYSQENSGGGVGLSGACVVDNCLIRSNNAATVVVYGGSPLVRNCTIVENTGGNSLALNNTSTALNCIVYFNVAPDVTVAGSAVIQYSCATGLPHGVNGNITNNPLFVNRAAGDFRLQPRSPCAEAGVVAGWTRADVDLEGKPRWSGPAVDMGAYESPSSGGSVFLFK